MNKILVIDDEQDIVEALSRGLNRRGYRVTTARSGEEGIENVKKGKFEVVLIDFKLPGINGAQTLEQIKKIDPEIEAVVITGYGSIESAIQSMKSGAYDYAEKPINIDKIAFLIEKALEKHQLTETVALYEISRAIFSTIEMDDLLKIIVDLSMRVLMADDASLMLFDEHNKLCIAHSHGLEQEVKINTRLALGERIAGWVAESKQAVILINGLHKDERFKDIEGRGEIKSAIVTPLIKNNQVLGILSINRIKIEENFTKVDLYKTNIFASLASLALDNANLYRSLKTARLQLSQSAKLAALGRLVSDMAHEVNNPLMIISGSAQLCLMEHSAKEEVVSSLNVIVEECRKAKEIIQRLLKFSRPSKGVFKKVNIHDCIESVANILEHQFSLSGVFIRRVYANDLPLVSIDEGQIHEVFMNLLNNAKDAMENGGEITIFTCLENKSLRIDLKDSGCGMSEDVMKNIFQPFFTTKEKGTGLGLPVCYGIIKAHNGEMRVESRSGAGTAVIINLPLREAGDAQDPDRR